MSCSESSIPSGATARQCSGGRCCEYVTRRKISGGTRHADGHRVRDTFAGLKDLSQARLFVLVLVTIALQGQRRILSADVIHSSKLELAPSKSDGSGSDSSE